MRTARPTAMLLSIALGTVLIGAAPVAAEDASPATGGECVASTAEENVALVRSFYDAIAADDEATMDALLADDVTHNANRLDMPSDPTSNADEIMLVTAMDRLYEGSEDVIETIFGADGMVAVETTRTITGHALAGQPAKLSAPFAFHIITIYGIECGEIVSMNSLANTLELMVAAGVIAMPGVAD